MPTQQIQLYLAFTHFSQSHRKKLVNGAACCKQTFHSLSATGLSRTLSLIFSWFLSKFSNLVKKKKIRLPPAEVGCPERLVHKMGGAVLCTFVLVCPVAWSSVRHKHLQKFIYNTKARSLLTVWSS